MWGLLEGIKKRKKILYDEKNYKDMTMAHILSNRKQKIFKRKQKGFQV